MILSSLPSFYLKQFCCKNWTVLSINFNNVRKFFPNLPFALRNSCHMSEYGNLPQKKIVMQISSIQHKNVIYLIIDFFSLFCQTKQIVECVTLSTLCRFFRNIFFLFYFCKSYSLTYHFRTQHSKLFRFNRDLLWNRYKPGQWIMKVIKKNEIFQFIHFIKKKNHRFLFKINCTILKPWTNQPDFPISSFQSNKTISQTMFRLIKFQNEDAQST